jgi:glycosyltransferase involved in cell wall biosynthesis
VCSFDYDEPVEAIFEAASRLPEVRFFVTGNAKRLSPALRSRIPPNLTLTGFLTTESYGGLLADADAALVLTTYDHTMLRGAYEAIYQSTPVIVSDWPLLRDAFPEGAIHVDNSSAAIVSAVRDMARDHARYKAGARLLREAKVRRWDATRRAILARLGEHALPQDEAC